MRTTLDIDDDILAAVKELAKSDGTTAGKVLSELARTALTTPRPDRKGFSEEQAELVVWHTLPNRGGAIVTNDLIAKIQAELDQEDAAPWDFDTEKPRNVRKSGVAVIQSPTFEKTCGLLPRRWPSW